MSRFFIPLICGLLFGLGLAVSQMVSPDRVIGFLDVTGEWDPSLAFVMIGALTVPMLCFRVILKRSQPVFAPTFQLTRKTEVDGSLLVGSGIFGIGWGMSGYCPGPAVAALGLNAVEAYIVVVSIGVGFFFHHWFFELKK